MAIIREKELLSQFTTTELLEALLERTGIKATEWDDDIMLIAAKRVDNGEE